jgi:hypothetical protein
MKTILLILAGMAATFVVAASAQEQAVRQVAATGETSYTTSWPHEIDGCKIMVQSRRSFAGEGAGFHELEGPDCDCNLVIDGYDGFFGQAEGYTAEKLLNVCERPGLDGNDEKYVLMREGLKQEPRFTVRSEILGR